MQKRETNHQHAPIIMTESYWMNTQLSMARYTGGINAFGQSYIIVERAGKLVQEAREQEPGMYGYKVIIAVAPITNPSEFFVPQDRG